MRFLLIFALVLSQDPSPTSAIGKRQPPQEQPSGKEQQTSPPTRGTDSTPVVVKVLDSQHRQADSAERANESKSKATSDWWVVWLTGFLVIVGAGQAGLFWWQLRLIRESLADARKAADAATVGADAAKEAAEATKASVVAAKETAQRQLRAYVISLGPSEASPFIPTPGSPNVKFEIRAVLRNTGQTPAYDVTGVLNIRVWPLPLPQNADLSLPSPTPDASAAVLGSGLDMTLIGHSPELTVAETAEVRTATQRRLHYIGRVTYRDTFGQKRYTNFLGSVIWGAKGIPIFLTAERHNDAD